VPPAGGGGPLLPPPLHAANATATSMRRIRKAIVVNCLRRGLGKKARTKDAVRASATNEEEKALCGGSQIKAAEVREVVAMVSVTETEFVPGVTLDDEKLHVDCAGRPEHVRATGATKGPQLGATCRGATATE
jgi:hypothetical protein